MPFFSKIGFPKGSISKFPNIRLMLNFVKGNILGNSPPFFRNRFSKRRFLSRSIIFPFSSIRYPRSFTNFPWLSTNWFFLSLLNKIWPCSSRESYPQTSVTSNLLPFRLKSLGRSPSSVSYFLSNFFLPFQSTIFPALSISQPFLLTNLPRLSISSIPRFYNNGRPVRSRSKSPLHKKGLKLCFSRQKGTGISPLSSKSF